MTVSPDDVLECCPRCGAWPMPARKTESGRTWAHLIFHCSQCDEKKTLHLTSRGIEAKTAPGAEVDEVTVLLIFGAVAVVVDCIGALPLDRYV